MSPSSDQKTYYLAVAVFRKPSSSSSSRVPCFFDFTTSRVSAICPVRFNTRPSFRTLSSFARFFSVLFEHRPPPIRRSDRVAMYRLFASLCLWYGLLGRASSEDTLATSATSVYEHCGNLPSQENIQIKLVRVSSTTFVPPYGRFTYSPLHKSLPPDATLLVTKRN